MRHTDDASLRFLTVNTAFAVEYNGRQQRERPPDDPGMAFLGGDVRLHLVVGPRVTLHRSDKTTYIKIELEVRYVAIRWWL